MHTVMHSHVVTMTIPTPILTDLAANYPRKLDWKVHGNLQLGRGVASCHSGHKAEQPQNPGSQSCASCPQPLFHVNGASVYSKWDGCS